MMKKLFVVGVLIIGMTTISNAQELGLRFGDVTGGNVAVDAVFATGEFNRIHADVSFGGGGVGIDALWDFVYRPLGEQGLDWYFGLGPGLYLHDPFWLSAVSELGIEYHFSEAPIALGADWRPTLRLIEETDFYFGFFGLNIRYVFN